MSATMSTVSGLALTNISAIDSGITFTLPPAPAAPAFTTSAGQGEIAVSWQPESSASGYEVEIINAATGSINTYNVGGGITSMDFSDLSPATLYVFNVAASNIGGTTWSTLQSAITQYNPIGTKPYAPAPSSVPLWGANGPSPFDVRQGATADCWLIASLSEVAARAPQDIENMFHYDGTTVEDGQTVGLYTVRFFDGNEAKYVTVDTQLPDGGYYNDQITGNNSPVLWVALAEKAYVEANSLGYVESNHPGVDSYTALNFGFPTWALHAITGQYSNQFSVNSNSLNTAWDDGDFVVLCTQTPSSPYLVPDHCYAVLSSDDGHDFELLNPWGNTASGYAPQLNNGQAVYGLFTASMSFIDQNFASVGAAVGTEPAAQPLSPPNSTNQFILPSSPTNSTNQLVQSSTTSAMEQTFDGISKATLNHQLVVLGTTSNSSRFVDLEDVDFGYSVQLD